MGELADLVEKTSSPADLGIVLLAGTAGLAIDAGLNLIGFLSPATTAFAFAGAALGLKKSGEAYVIRRTARRSAPLGATDRAKALIDEFRAIGATTQASAIEGELRLRDKRIISEEALQARLDEAADELRDQLTVRSLIGRPAPKSSRAGEA